MELSAPLIKLRNYPKFLFGRFVDRTQPMADSSLYVKANIVVGKNRRKFDEIAISVISIRT